MAEERDLKRGRKPKGGGEGRDVDAVLDGANRRVKFTRPPPVPGKPMLKNYAVWNLDEPAAAAHESWRLTILQFRLWCYNTSTDRYFFGDDRRRSCKLPVAGHFLVYIHYHGRWMVAVIDGPTGYLDGYITRSVGKEKRIQENRTYVSSKLSKEERRAQMKMLPLYIECADMLPWPGSYAYASSCTLGYPNLVKSFNIMYKNIERATPIPSEKEIQIAGEMFILHLPEASRSDKLYRKADINFEYGIKVGIVLVNEAQCWSGRTIKALDTTEDLTPDKWELKNRSKAAGSKNLQSFNDTSFELGLKEVLEIFEDVRLFYREEPKHGKFQLVNMPVHLGPQGPLNNDLDKELIKDGREHQDSLFLIQPFLPFNCKNDNVNQNIGSGVTNKLSDEVTDDLAISEEKTESKNCDSLITNMAKENLQVLDCVTENLFEIAISSQVSKHKAEGCKGSAAIHNLGRTCYASCALQYFHCVPELQSELAKYLEGSQSVNVDHLSHNLIEALHKTIVRLGQNTEPIRPHHFMKRLREKFPIFQEKDGSLFRQQDMGDCCLRLIETLSMTLRTEASGSASDPIKHLFGIDLISRAPNADENQFQTVYHLYCPITDYIDHLEQGLENVLRAENLKINKLPRYLTIQFDRVSYNKRGQSVKILRKVDFPSELDVCKHCSNELKCEIQAKRKGSKSNVGESTGTYDLIAVVTHEGGTADACHYVAFVKQDDSSWIQFDDDRKFIWREVEVLELCGGGDGPTACVCLYKSHIE